MARNGMVTAALSMDRETVLSMDGGTVLNKGVATAGHRDWVTEVHRDEGSSGRRDKRMWLLDHMGWVTWAAASVHEEMDGETGTALTSGREREIACFWATAA